MTAQRRRHHYIPRFLLARFASRRKGKKSWIIQVDATGSEREISTRDAAVSHGFYDGEKAVEDDLAGLEEQLSRRLRQIDGGADPNAFGEELSRLVWILSLRTRTFRRQIGRTWKDLFIELDAWMRTPEGRAFIVSYLDESVDQFVKEGATGLPWYQRVPVLMFFRIEFARRWARAKAREYLRSGKIDPLVASLFGYLTEPSMTEGLIRKGQVDGLRTLLDRPAPPASFSSVHWSLQEMEDESFILGDSCVVAMDASGQPRSLVRLSDSWIVAFLPISPRTVLVAHRSPAEVRVLERINRLSAASSWAYVFSSDRDLVTPELSAMIGTRAKMFRPEEIRGWFNGATG